ncbi:hypothetical protein, partial [Pseudomonas sp. KK4]|uniref:hypothetical protein n=1 Tax=Pseudomonas sp. KK4 TaxID=1855729 RepID=UPI001C491507
AFVAREFTPARLRSSRKAYACGVSGEMEWQGLGLLRSPAGASSLATEFVWVKKRGAAAFAFVVRGFIPARLRSSRKACACGGPEEMGWQGLGLLRSPAGINPLTTGGVWVK